MFRHAFAPLLIIICLISASAPRVAHGQQMETATVQAATSVLSEAMTTPGNKIPRAMLSDAYGVAIIPNVIKGGFIVGARFGRGLLFIRDANGIWHAPVFITLTGGNIGWQVGVQASDIILVFKTLNSVQGILQGKLTIGADAAASAGPIGRQTAAATDGQLKAEIYTYSRSRGLFAGVSIDGSVVRTDPLATSSYYHSAGPGTPLVIPPAALQLTQSIARYAGSAPQTTPTPVTPAPVTPAPPVGGSPGIPFGTPIGGNPQAPSGIPVTPASTVTVITQNPPIVRQQVGSEADVLRTQLTKLAPELYEKLDDNWKNYLALPSSIFLTGEHPSAAEIATVLEHFQSIATNPAYKELASYPAFQSVYGVLRHYQQTITSTSAALNLPPPPTR
ncbi:lipid-binding SYLF domain-containing protein [bacterium]|nr:lipid-binding SYLF domain-containing protein [bacterium]MDB4423097.1 lipid-binding SYLF domain-containing protein [Rhodopirellula sp.]